MGVSSSTDEKLDASGLKIAVVASRYNEEICDGLINGALNELQDLGLSSSEVKVLRVPGAFELPLIAKALAKQNQWDAVLCLGAVIQGETAHFDYVCQGVTYGIQQAMLETGTPIAFGVLTTDNLEQAKMRCSDNKHNKGREAARTAVEMVILKKQIL